MEWVVLSATGGLGVVDVESSVWTARQAQQGARADDDVIRSAVVAYDGGVGLITSTGSAHRIDTGDLPRLVPGGPWSLWDAPKAQEMIRLDAPAEVVGLLSLDLDAPALALGTRNGVVKRVSPEYNGWSQWEVMSVKPDDTIIGVSQAGEADELVFITANAQLLRLTAREVRPQGRSAGGMAGIKVTDNSEAIFFTAVAKSDRDDVVVVTLANGRDSVATIKQTALREYPAKGRATTGVRTHRFLKGQTHLDLAWVGIPPVRACDAKGSPRNVSNCDDRRDGTGVKVYGSFFAFG
ncbi:MAG: hypothetical protein LBV06_02770 [Propionibacteriaceae bacterium]|jgi:DNA gyrase subunit A|nr:hypothetical protein [Propionibacteriaceae bacterium]